MATVGETSASILQAAEAVAARDISTLPVAEWFSRFAYLADADGYFDLVNRRPITRQSFNAHYRHVKCISIHTGHPIHASNSYDENRAAMGGVIAAGLTYAPGAGALLERHGEAWGNLWRNARVQPVAGDASPWLDHLARLLPCDWERNHLLDCLAFKFQHPDRKINHGILIAGHPGSGKDSALHPFLQAVGGPQLQNVAVVRGEDIISQFGYALENEVLLLNELRRGVNRDKRAVEEFMKVLCAAPPELIMVNRKMQHPYPALNRGLPIAMSNFRDAIHLSDDDRRWFVLWSDAPKMTQEAASALWQWYGSGGIGNVAYTLSQRALGAFNPAAPPPMTEAKRRLLNVRQESVEETLLADVRARRGVFAEGIIGGPWGDIARKIEPIINRGIIPVNVLTGVMALSGWTNRGNIATARNPNRRIIYTAPDSVYGTMNSAQCRDALETLFPSLRLVQ
jgi:hypothetical protein